MAFPWLKVVAAIATWEIGWYYVGVRDRARGYDRAQTAARAVDKPLLIVGAPHGQYPCGEAAAADVVLDLDSRTARECPNFVQSSAESIPFPDKHFGAAYVSHVIEHCCDPKAVEAELHRVADRVIVCYPRWWRLVTWLVPGHVWIITPTSPQADRFNYVRIRGQQACNVATRLGPGFSGAPTGESQSR